MLISLIQALAAQAAINQQLQAAGATSQALATQAALASYVQQQIQVFTHHFHLSMSRLSPRGWTSICVICCVFDILMFKSCGS